MAPTVIGRADVSFLPTRTSDAAKVTRNRIQFFRCSVGFLDTAQEQRSPESHGRVSHQSRSIWVNPDRPTSLEPHPRRNNRVSKWEARHFLEVRDYAETIDRWTGPEDALLVLINDIPHPPTRGNALCVLHTLKSWEKSLLFFTWLKKKASFPMETLFYNLVLKSLRSGYQFDLVEKLAAEMTIERVELDAVTYCTIITAAKRCQMLQKAEEWFERMCSAGVNIDDLTYSSMLHYYAQLGKVEEMGNLYRKARMGEWKPDQIALSILVRGFGDAGDAQGVSFMLQEMSSLEIQPNAFLFNTMLFAMGKCRMAQEAKDFFNEMMDSGVIPDEKSTTTILRIYGRSKWVHDALALWERVRAKGLKIDLILYNMLLAMCADLGSEGTGEKIFEEMKGIEECRPNAYSYSAMLHLYANGLKVDKAMNLFEEMVRLGIETNVGVFTCVLQCLGRAKMLDDFVRVFGMAVEKGIRPSERFCGCLLNVISSCAEAGDRERILPCLRAANPRLASFIRILEDGSSSEETLSKELGNIFERVTFPARRPYCNSFIDTCRNMGFTERAAALFNLGKFHGLYGKLHEKGEDEWRLNILALSVGVVKTALDEWKKSLSLLVQRGVELPPLFSVRSGAGNHKFSSGIGAAFADHAAKLGAPFCRSTDNPALFFAAREEIISWVRSDVPS